MNYHDIKIDSAEIAEVCRKYHIRKLALFGSVLRPDFGSSSDIDVIVEFEPGQVPGLEFFDIEEELSSCLGRKVDLHTPHSLSHYFVDRVLAESEVLYGAV